MKTQEIHLGEVKLGGGNGLFLIAGPCVIEKAEDTLDIAKKLKAICEEAKIPLIFKASFDKANRSSIASYRGPGLIEGLAVLAAVRKQFKLPVLTDFHEPGQADQVAESVDILQVPAFLSRQTDMLVAAGKTGKPVNVKKGQFMAPGDMMNIVEKIRSTDNDEILLTERGTSFGYNYLVNDMRCLPAMRRLGYPVIFDATHSVQLPGAHGGRTSSGGERQFVAPLARAAVAAGVDGVFIEAHPDPDKALSDGSNMLSLDALPTLLKLLVKLDRDVREFIANEKVEPAREIPVTGMTLMGGIKKKPSDDSKA